MEKFIEKALRALPPEQEFLYEPKERRVGLTLIQINFLQDLLEDLLKKKLNVIGKEDGHDAKDDFLIFIWDLQMRLDGRQNKLPF